MSLLWEGFHRPVSLPRPARQPEASWIARGAPTLRRSIAGSGRADEVAEGFRLSGRWSFCTNSLGCPWDLGSFTVTDNDTPRVRRDGGPDTRWFYLPAWDVLSRTQASTGNVPPAQHGSFGFRSYDEAVRARFGLPHG